MKTPDSIRKISILAGTLVAALVLSTGAIAQHGGGGGHGGGGHGFGGGGRGFAGGHAIAGGHAFGGYGGYHGAYGGYHGGYGGWHGGYGGWRGGWRGYGGWGGWGWGWGGLGLGLYFASLPLYYDTYWWGGVPYYYANDTYYVYDPNVQEYETVAPPEGLAAQVGGPSGNSTELMAYPKNGQSAEQQSRDKFECHQWAASQSGFDPTTATASSATAQKRNDYMRAQAACLEGRGYSVQ